MKTEIILRNLIRQEAKQLLQNYDTIYPEVKYLCSKAESAYPNLYEALESKFKGNAMEYFYRNELALTSVRHHKTKLFRLAYLTHIAKTGYLPSIPTVIKIAKELDLSHPPIGGYSLCR